MRELPDFRAMPWAVALQQIREEKERHALAADRLLAAGRDAEALEWDEPGLRHVTVLDQLEAVAGVAGILLAELDRIDPPVVLLKVAVAEPVMTIEGVLNADIIVGLTEPALRRLTHKILACLQAEPWHGRAETQWEGRDVWIDWDAAGLPVVTEA
jgi:hypothetical protein